ncbi:MAG: serine/threonine protein kinase [Verrucomicrobiales bacterium]|nr:serine/threonine protein kinase [Verrucomicrobiales bacterium]
MNPEEIHIKDYQIHLPALGEGSYGRVYRATYRGISDRALKIFRPGAVDLSTMARELEKLSSVAEHHGIVTLHDFDLLADPPYYAMGLHADHRSDGTWVTRTLDRLCGKVDPREAWRLLREIADALAYLHRNHIIHCDVKPTNILLTDEMPYRVKLCDFGQSRGDALEGFHPAGTPLYASPEQLRRPRDSAEGRGFRWDVYSFGVVAYRLFTGKFPRLQSLAEAEKNSFDPESTIAESNMDGTLDESRNIDSERLAQKIEAEPDIKWPAGLHIPHDRRELIERCLDLDPSKRPADMREVFNRMTDVDQQRVMRRSRRLNALFATLLVIAIWATGFALLQARRAHDASAEANKTREQAEELVFFIVNKLNREELSGPSLDELYDHIADNAETYLANLPKTRRSATLLRISANTASMRGRQALETGDLDLALEKFTRGFEIRSQLAAETADIPELGWLASNDLMEIGEVQTQRGQLKAALAAYQDALDWRIRDVDLKKPLTLPQLRRIIETLTAIAGIHEKSGDLNKAIAQIQRAIGLHEITAATLEPAVEATLGTDLITMLKELGRLQFAQADLDGSELSYNRLLEAATQLAGTSEPPVSAQAQTARATALHALGAIQIARGETEKALAYYREEVKSLETFVQRHPYDSAAKIQLAEAYHSIAQSFDLAEPARRSVALYHLERAVATLGELPQDQKDLPDIQDKMLAYHDEISRLLELEE